MIEAEVGSMLMVRRRLIDRRCEFHAKRRAVKGIATCGKLNIPNSLYILALMLSLAFVRRSIVS